MRTAVLDYKITGPALENYTGRTDRSTVDHYQGKETKKIENKCRTGDEKWNPGNTSGTYKGTACGPMLAYLGQSKLLVCVVGANGEISKDFKHVLDAITDHLTPEAVRLWYLEGESGTRLHTRGTIAFIVRRRLTGSIWRAHANLVLNRLWFIGGGARGAPTADGRAFQGDAFDDPFSRFAGRSSSGGGG